MHRNTQRAKAHRLIQHDDTDSIKRRFKKIKTLPLVRVDRSQNLECDSGRRLDEAGLITTLLQFLKREIRGRLGSRWRAPLSCDLAQRAAQHGCWRQYYQQ